MCVIKLDNFTKDILWFLVYMQRIIKLKIGKFTFS